MPRYTVLFLMCAALGLAGCSLFESGDTQAAGGVTSGSPTSIAGAPRAATGAWTTPAPSGYAVRPAAPQAPSFRAPAASAPQLPSAPPSFEQAPAWTPPAPAPEPAPAPGAGKG